MIERRDCVANRKAIMRTVTIALVLAAGMALAGCDRCGDFWNPLGQLGSCHADAPRPQ